MSTALACVRAYVRMYVRACLSARPAWERVKSVWLGTSADWVSDGWLRTLAKGQEHLAAIIMETFLSCACIAMKVKFVLELPSGTGVGHELSKAARVHASATVS